MSPIPSALPVPSPRAGQASSVVPASPTMRPHITSPDGARRVTHAATMAVNNGLAPFSMPVSAEDTRSSANGNMPERKGELQDTEQGDPAPVRSWNRRRAEGNHDNVANPIAIRTKVTPLGPIELKLQQ